VAGFGVAGWLAWRDVGTWTVFVFVTLGWVVSLCLHEFAHAAVAFVGGDRSVAHKGYLTLDPRHYADITLSVWLPLLFVLLGGIGLPGGAVWIDRRALRNRWVESAVSLAGPTTNLVIAFVVLVPLGLGRDWAFEHPTFASGLGFLALLEVSSVLLNLLPVPPLDGYGAVSPHLSTTVRRQAAGFARWGIFVVFACLWVPSINAAFFDAVYELISATGADPGWSSEGYRLYRFWER